MTTSGPIQVICVALVLVCFAVSQITCCHNVLQTEENFSSPNFPDNYPDNANCTWLIEKDQPVVIVFTSYHLEKCCDFLTVRNSSLISKAIIENYIFAQQIYDGHTTSSPVLFDASSDNSTQIIATSTTVLVTFISDGSGSTPGFEASIQVFSSYLLTVTASSLLIF